MKSAITTAFENDSFLREGLYFLDCSQAKSVAGAARRNVHTPAADPLLIRLLLCCLDLYVVAAREKIVRLASPDFAIPSTISTYYSFRLQTLGPPSSGSANVEITKNVIMVRATAR